MNQFIRGMIIPIEGGGSTIRFQWNPRELQGFGARAEYAILKVAGRETPFLQFACGDVPTLEIELKFTKGSSDDGYVMRMVDTLQRLTKPLIRGATLHRPPRVMWVFGDMPKRRCVVARADPRYQGLFSASLAPHEATVSLTLLEHKG